MGAKRIAFCRFSDEDEYYFCIFYVYQRCISFFVSCLSNVFIHTPTFMLMFIKKFVPMFFMFSMTSFDIFISHIFRLETIRNKILP